MNLTLFADASWCPTTKAAGWGAWAKRNEWQSGRFVGDPFKSAIASAREAELCAIANALILMKGTRALDRLSGVMVQSDCLHALRLMLTQISGVIPERPKEGGSDIFRLRKPRPSELEVSALTVIRQTVGVLRLSVRHVKGHKGGEGRSWVNRQCDRIAREHMLTARKVLEVAA